MRFSHILLVAMASFNPHIIVINSKTHPGKSWILVDDCAVEVTTSDFTTNPDKIVKQVNDFCDLSLDHVIEKK